MRTTPESADLCELYPTPRISGQMITRMEERPLAWSVLDAATARMLGTEQLGWFVGNHPGLARAAAQFARLDEIPNGGVWMVVPLGKQMSVELWSLWPHPHPSVTAPTEDSPVWRSRRVWVAPPESLARVVAEFAKTPPALPGSSCSTPRVSCLRPAGAKTAGVERSTMTAPSTS